MSTAEQRRVERQRIREESAKHAQAERRFQAFEMVARSPRNVTLSLDEDGEGFSVDLNDGQPPITFAEDSTTARVMGRLAEERGLTALSPAKVIEKQRAKWARSAPIAEVPDTPVDPTVDPEPEPEPEPEIVRSPEPE